MVRAPSPPMGERRIMENKNTYPYSDDLMIFDEKTYRYYLTETALETEGIYLRARLSRSALIDVTSVINGFVRTVTTHTYTFLHQFAQNISLQDRVIATNPRVRDIIYRVMVEQAKYVIRNGDMSLSPDPKEYRAYFAPNAGELIINSGLAYIGGC